MKGVEFLSKIHPLLSESEFALAIEPLSRLTDTEDFDTHRDEYVKDLGDAQTLLTFRLEHLAGIIGDPVLRKTIRPLLDATERVKRLYRL